MTNLPVAEVREEEWEAEGAEELVVVVGCSAAEDDPII